MTASTTRHEDANAPGSVEPSVHVSCDELVAGDIIGDKYRFETLIAEGGMGIVLRATHIELGSPVAIKVVRPEHATNEEVVGRLLAEARIAANLRSKHVNRVLDVGRFDSGIPYLVLEYLEGGDLAERLTEVGHFSVGQATDYVLQACEGLAEAHAIGIVHRDLKPENLFLSEEPDGERVLKILDFGISKAPHSRGGRVLTKPWHVVGSPSYMPPEQMQGAELDGRADVWALGIVLYELCVGRLPFDSPSVKEIFLRVLGEEPIPPSWLVEGMDEAFERVVFKCLRKDPDERYASVVELAEALLPFASDPARVARVSKVAAATLGRLGHSHASDPPREPLAPTTPLTSAASRLPSVRLSLHPRRRRAAWLLGISAAASVALGAVLSTVAGFSPPRPVSVVPAASQTAAAAQLQPPADLAARLDVKALDVEALEVLPASLPVAPLTAAPRKAAPVRRWIAPAPVYQAPVAPTAAGPGVASKTPSVATASAVAPAASLGSRRGSLDAWDRSSFGGRR